ncbi:Ff.00g001380.m01.CDS01 [Fusarium sp. VM40]|nr:Ff.00g001380.m01.CDS01 [Fusarium sp. VM40]
MSATPPIPAPYDATPKPTQLLFRRFHQSIGEWPWELVEAFEPNHWGQNLLSDFTRLLKVDLPSTPGVGLQDVLTFMFDQSAFHPISQYKCTLSRSVVAQATKWLQDKRMAGEEPPQSKNPESEEFRSLPVKIEPEDDSNAEVSRRITRSQTAYQRKRTHEIINLSDDEEGAKNGNEVQVTSSTHIAKKRLMMYFSFKSPKGQEQLKVVGDCISVQGDESDKPAGELPGQQSQTSISNNDELAHIESSASVRDNPSVGESPFVDVTFKSFEDAQAAYSAYLKEQVDKSQATIHRSRGDIDTARQQRKELLESHHMNNAAKEKAVSDASSAQKALQRATALCAAEDEVLEQVRRISANHPSVISDDALLGIVSSNSRNSEAQLQKQAAAANLDAKKKCLADICNKLQLAEAQAAPLLSKIYDLCETEELEKKNQRTLTILNRLIQMGPKLVDFLEEVLGDKDIDEWTEDKLRQVQEANIL